MKYHTCVPNIVPFVRNLGPLASRCGCWLRELAKRGRKVTGPVQLITIFGQYELAVHAFGVTFFLR